MITDYKGVDLSLKKKKINIIRILFVLFIFLLIYFFFSNIVDKKKIISIQELLLQNNTIEAFNVYKKIKQSLYHKGSKDILKGIFSLYSQDYKNAITLFKSIETDDSLIDHNKFIIHFFEDLKYRELDIYLNFIGKSFKNYYYYKALLSTAMLKYKESERFLSKVKADNDKNIKKKILKLKGLNKELKKGKIHYIFDINGSPLAYYDTQTYKTMPVDNFKGFYFNDFSDTIKNGIRFFTLTINKNIQKKIHSIFSRYKLKGSFILLKTDDNSLVAAYSKSRKKENFVFFKQYEPGSIVKLLTLYGYLKNNLKGIFPYDCKSLNINNTPFYDWVSHKKVDSFEKALAWSCNIGFAKIGIKLGLERITKVYSDFLFNKKGINDLFIKFKMGTFFPDKIKNDYEIAKVSVGLSLFNNDSNANKKDLITITTIHSGLISSAIANKGIVNSPFLIRNIKSISAVGSYNHKAIEIKNINSPLIFNKIKNAMIKVVTDKRGTGKNSLVEFVQVALKTGTAGDSKPYNAILTGFFPSNRPKYAFAFILEKSGPSKDKGAKFLKDFLTIFFEKNKMRDL